MAALLDLVCIFELATHGSCTKEKSGCAVEGSGTKRQKSGTIKPTEVTVGEWEEEGEEEE